MDLSIISIGRQFCTWEVRHERTKVRLLFADLDHPAIYLVKHSEEFESLMSKAKEMATAFIDEKGE